MYGSRTGLTTPSRIAGIRCAAERSGGNEPVRGQLGVFQVLFYFRQLSAAIHPPKKGKVTAKVLAAPLKASCVAGLAGSICKTPKAEPRRPAAKDVARDPVHILSAESAVGHAIRGGRSVDVDA